jgi:prepilin-type N-terminal cleavage/methylation domain-containing protein
MLVTRRNPRDGGFTLIELLIVIVILGVITLPLGELLITYFRNTTQTTLRLNESHDGQVTNAYWQQDVASVGVRGPWDSANNTFPLAQSVNTGFPCSLPAGVASPFVVLAWDQFDSAGAPTRISVAYATQASGKQLVRLHCTTTTLDSNVVLAHNLASVPAVTCAGPGGSSCTGGGANVPATISLPLSIHDSSPANTGATYVVTFIGQRRQTT